MWLQTYDYENINQKMSICNEHEISIPKRYFLHMKEYATMPDSNLQHEIRNL